MVEPQAGEPDVLGLGDTVLLASNRRALVVGLPYGTGRVLVCAAGPYIHSSPVQAVTWDAIQEKIA